MSKRNNERGAIELQTIIVIILAVLFVAAAGFAVWAFVNYSDQKANVDSKVKLAVAEASREQSEIEQEKFAEREKEPNRQFVGPDDYGRLGFSYPKTWSVYVAKDVSRGGTFEAYLNPVTVPPVTTTQQFALRVIIEEKDYDEVIRSYEAAVKKGDLRTGAVSAGGNNGTRFDGSFTKDIRGSAVVYKIRDKTVTLRTDADTFKPDFETIIKTITFNQ